MYPMFGNMILILIWIASWVASIIIGSRKGLGCSAAIIGLVAGPIGLLLVIIDKGHRKKCPYCQEYINEKAVKCPKCQSYLVQRTPNPIRKPKQMQSKYLSNSEKKDSVKELVENVSEHDTFSMMNFDKFTELPSDTLQLVVQAVKQEIFEGIPRDKILSLLIASYPEIKDTIISYANTMKADYIQMQQYMNAVTFPGKIYWKYEGPDDNLTRPICRDLLEIKYFTNWQRKKAEKLSQEERKFDCRHTFMIISESYYYEGIKNRKIDYTRLSNQSLVRDILEE